MHSLDPTWVEMHVDGVSCEGEALRVLRHTADAPPNWHPAWTYRLSIDDDEDREIQCIELVISPSDYLRIVEPHRVADTPVTRAEALQFHIRRVQGDLARQFQELRVCALRGRHLAEAVVAAGWLNPIPTREQWSELEVTKKGVSLESLARSGLLEAEFGITAPRWKSSAPRFNDTVNEFESVAWAPEFERAVAQAVAPYVAALKEAEAEMQRPELSPDTEPPCSP